MIRTLVFLSVLCGAAPAFAVECPADQRGVFVHLVRPSDRQQGVTEETLGAIELGAYQLPGRNLRTRKLIVEPGGIIAWHNHATRPALTYVLQGEMTEVRASCGAPLIYRAGDIVVEDAGVAHWWRNEGTAPAVLVSTDLMPAN